MGGWRSSAMRSDCVNLRGENKRHCRLERLIGSAVSVQALLSAALGPSTITVGVSSNVMTCHRRMLHAQSRNYSSRSAVRHDFQAEPIACSLNIGLKVVDLPCTTRTSSSTPK
jgi:hypothetical protein